jgi:hypothetical protein
MTKNKKRLGVAARSRAALKAWETRRANELAEERSLMFRKAKRSIAARKAWRTRRRRALISG